MAMNAPDRATSDFQRLFAAPLNQPHEAVQDRQSNLSRLALGRSRRGVGTNPVTAAYLRCANLPEASMKIAKIALASIAALAFIGSATLAQQATTGTGMITVLDRIHGTVAIRQAPSGTVGASNGGVVTEFKVKGVSLDAVHAGDRVTFSATETGGIKTITKIEKQ
jgi:Cu/Ag efflux protein CusF